MADPGAGPLRYVGRFLSDPASGETRVIQVGVRLARRDKV